jgi:hypothetical protein
VGFEPGVELVEAFGVVGKGGTAGCAVRELKAGVKGELADVDAEARKAGVHGCFEALLNGRKAGAWREF